MCTALTRRWEPKESLGRSLERRSEGSSGVQASALWPHRGMTTLPSPVLHGEGRGCIVVWVRQRGLLWSNEGLKVLSEQLWGQAQGLGRDWRRGEPWSPPCISGPSSLSTSPLCSSLMKDPGNLKVSNWFFTPCLFLGDIKMCFNFSIVCDLQKSSKVSTVSYYISHTQCLYGNILYHHHTFVTANDQYWYSVTKLQNLFELH